MDEEFNAIQTAVATKADTNSPTLTGTPFAPTATAGTNTTQIATTAFVQAAGSSLLPPGVILPYAGTATPAGFLLCSGAAVSRTTYANLYAAIGTTYGVGDGSTTFNLPNSYDRMLLGAGSSFALGGTGGSRDAVVVAHTHTGTTSTGGTHTHGITVSTSTATGTDGVVVQGNTGVTTLGATGSDGSHNHTFTTDSAGVSATNANLPPYLGTYFIIKT